MRSKTHFLPMIWGFSFCALTGFGEDYVDPNFAGKPNLTPQLVVDAQGFSGPIARLAISDDGRWLAGVADKNVRVWNLESGVLHAVLRGYQEPDGFHIGSIDSLTFAPDNEHLMVGVSDNSEQGSTRVYDLRSPDEIKQLVNGHTGCTRGIAFTRSGNRMATWGCDGFVVFYLKNQAGDWDVDFRVPWGGVSTAPIDQLYMPDDIFDFTDDEQYLAFLFHSPIVISVAKKRALTGLSEVPTSIKSILETRRAPFSDWYVTHMLPFLGKPASSSDLFAVGAGYGKSKGEAAFFGVSWNSEGSSIAVHNHSYRVTALAWNRRAGIAASADALGRIHVWDPATGKSTHSVIRSITKSIWNVRWAADGRHLLYSDVNYPVGQWNFNRWGGTDKKLSLDTFVETKSEIRMPDHPIKPTAFHPQLGHVELVVSNNDSSGNATRNAILGEYDLKLTYPGQNKNSQSLIPWGLADRERGLTNFRIRVPQRKFGMVRCVRFIEYPGCISGSTCIIGTETGKLFEATIEKMSNGFAELHLRKEFLGHTAAITSFDVSPNQKTLVTGSLDGTIRVFPLTPPMPCGDIDFLHDGTGIVNVPQGGESARAGILVDDTMLTFDDGSFYERIRKQQTGQYKPGDRVKISVNRGVQMNERRRVLVNVTLVESPQLVMPLTSMLLASSGEWIAWTPEGYYDSSSGGGKFVGWHINRAREQTAKFFTVEQFQKQYYQPKVVRYAITEQSSTLAIAKADGEIPNFAAAKPLSSTTPTELQTRIPPQIDILSPSPNSVSRDSKVRVVSRVRIPSNAALSSIRFQVDGHSVEGKPRVTNEQNVGAVKEIWYEQTLELPVGKRGITVQAVCTNETQADRTLQCVIKRFDPEASQQGTLYILAIGLSEYSDANFQLQYGAKDAADFTQAWRDLAKRTPENIELKVLQNAQATCQAIREEGLQWLLQQPIKSEDTVLVFLSGHALFDRNEDWYFGGHDLDPERLISTGISDAELDSVLRKVPTNLILFTDTCHAGGFQSSKNVFRNPASGASVWRGRGHVVFASCLPQESSFEAEQWGHGAFTKAILDFLTSNKSDYNQNGELTFDEMVLFVKTAVSNMTNNMQNPTIEMPSTVSNIPFTRVK